MIWTSRHHNIITIFFLFGEGGMGIGGRKKKQRVVWIFWILMFSICSHEAPIKVSMCSHQIPHCVMIIVPNAFSNCLPSSQYVPNSTTFYVITLPKVELSQPYMWPKGKHISNCIWECKLLFGKCPHFQKQIYDQQMKLVHCKEKNQL
jgi:hypothetical protein